MKVIMNKKQKIKTWNEFGLKQTLKETTVFKDIFYGRICKLSVIGTIIFITLYLLMTKNDNINPMLKPLLTNTIVDTMATMVFSILTIQIMIKNIDKSFLDAISEMNEKQKQKLLQVKRLISYFYAASLSNLLFIFFVGLKVIILYTQIPKAINIILLVMTTFTFLIALLVNSVFFVNLLSTFILHFNFMVLLIPITVCMVIIVLFEITFLSFSISIINFVFASVYILM